MRKGLLLAAACFALTAAPAHAAPAQTAAQAELRFDSRYEPTSTRLFKPRLDNVKPGSRVTVRCTGKHSPLKSYTWRDASGTVSLYRFAYRRLRAGVRLRIRLTEPGRKTRTATIRIRAGREPLVTGTIAH